jgi:DNA replication and repair protein RecF
VGFVSLSAVSFRNLSDTEIDILGKDVFLVGENGQGKSNFLEALYFCSYGSSFRGVRDNEMVRTGEKDCSVSIKLDGSMYDTVRVILKNGKKSITLDSKKIEDRKDLLEVAPCIVFCHEDMDFVAGPPEKRRWFFDQCQTLCNGAYLEDLRNYRRVLKTRNAILRDYKGGTGLPKEAAAVLDALDPQLAQYGFSLMKKRQKAAADFSRVFEPLYREISNLDGILVSYAPSWKEESPDGILKALAGKRGADVSFGVSLSGPHRDRYAFSRRGHEFSGKASTGQRRLLALLLRVAQARFFSEATGKNPVLLLDDVLLELDNEKRRKFLEIMPGYEQAFFTFLPGEPYDRYRKNDTIVYHVEAGNFLKENYG